MTKHTPKVGIDKLNELIQRKLDADRTAKHTPGKFYKDTDGDITVVRLDGERNDFIDPIIAEFLDDFATIEEAEANANLYIAAPELEQFVDRVANALVDAHDEDWGDILATLVDDARALLSRIEGE